MAYAWTTFTDELTTHIVTAWTDVLPANGGGGVNEMDEAARLSREGFDHPYAVFDIHSVQSADWGLVNCAFEAAVDVHYIGRESLTEAGLRAKLEALKARIVSRTTEAFSTATALDDGLEMDWGGSHPAMAIFEARNIPFVGGSLTFRVVLGELL